MEVVGRILQADDRGLTMIFTRTKRAADKVAEDLDFRGFAVAAVHGDLGQGARERALRAFRAGKIDVLVATDVAARGLDVTGVTHVVNYDCPEDADTYIHRIGRTGRAGEAGVAVTFVDWDDMPRWRLIDKSLGLDMPEPAETYHTSEHLFTDLDIPRDSTGTLASAERTRVGLSAEKLEDVEGKRGGGRPTRGRSSGGTRGGGGPRSTTVADAEQPTRQRERQRRRRGEVPTEGNPAAGSSASSALSAPEATPHAAVEVGVDGAGETTGPRRPKRRRRGGRGRGEIGATDPAGSTGSDSGETGNESAQG
jgi:superfamily II DNA/RNA helicase